MALPVLNAPTHEMTLVSNGQTIKFRPFLVKEEKILLMALESDDENEMTNAMRQIISNCVIDDIDIDDLPIFDIQYIFLQLRSKSVGEIITLTFKHPDNLNREKQECKHIQQVEVNLANIKPTSTGEHSNKIDLTPEIGVTMKYPKLDFYSKLMEMATNENATIQSMFDIMTSSIDMIYQGDNVFYRTDHSEEEMNDFLNSLTASQFDKIRNFFQTMPYLRHEFDYTCGGCGSTEHVILNGIEDFFA